MLLLVVPVLVNVAFITLLERKVLGYSQLRKGPNKVGLIGLVQPFNDAIKLFTKEMVFPNSSNSVLFLFRPAIAIVLSLIVWIILPDAGIFLRVSLRIILMYIVLRINIYPLMASGWSSNSVYASIGALRGVAQTVSYEVRFALIILIFLISGERLRLLSLIEHNLYWFKMFLFLPIIFLWLITRLAETNRTPFDFAEGESELVSGFNIEYGRVGFALIFMAEYARIYFISTVFILVFFSVGSNSIIYYIIVSVVVFFWIWVRATLPRYRYDMLISLTWISYLPITLILLSYCFFLLL